ncbi:MAG: hypothetical protein E7667_01140 [Ruminococcaceae bacterium]|nr:hypothetical protein [Oscillospiraceae bacterium]
MDKDQKNLLGMIGICKGAGATVIGVPMICEELRKKAKKERHILVLEASNTSENTHKKITDKCKFYNVKHVRLSCDCLTLGRAVGKSAVAAVAVMGENFCRAVEAKLSHDSEQ